MKSKKLFTLLAAIIVIVLAFAACGRNDDPAPATPVPATPAPDDAADDTPGDAADDVEDVADEGGRDPRWAEHIVLEFFVDHDPTEGNERQQYNLWHQYMYERFNITIRNIQEPGGDYRQNLSLMLAARTFPDIIRVRQADLLMAYVDAGALIKLDDHLDALPDWTEFNRDIIPILRALGPDGNLWFYHCHQPNFANGFATPWLEWIMRSDILEQQGWPQPRDENDIYDILTQGLIDNPYTGGFPTIGFSHPLAAWGTNGLLTLTYSYVLGPNSHLFHNRGMLYDVRRGYFIDVTEELSYKAGLQFFNRLWRSGMYFRDAVTMDIDPFDEMMSMGRILSSFFYAWQMPTWNQRLRDAGAEFRYVPVPIMMAVHHEAGDMKRGTIPNPELWVSHAITTNAQDVERMIYIINWQATYEGIVRTGWGVEGISFYYDENGIRTPSTEERRMRTLPMERGSERWTWSWGGPQIFGSYGGFDHTGQSMTMGNCPVFAMEALDPIVMAYLNRFGWNSYQEMYENHPHFDYDVVLTVGIRNARPDWDDRFDDAWIRIDTATHEYTMRLVTAASEEEFDRLFASMQARRNSYGLPEMLEIWNAQFAERMAALGN